MSDSASQAYVVRAEIHHVPGNPFTDGSAPQSFADGGLVVVAVDVPPVETRDGDIRALGEAAEFVARGNQC